MIYSVKWPCSQINSSTKACPHIFRTSLKIYIMLTYMTLLTHSVAQRKNNYTLIPSHTPTCSCHNLYTWTCSHLCTCSHTKIWMNIEIHVFTNTNYNTSRLKCSKHKHLHTFIFIGSCSHAQAYSHMNLLKHEHSQTHQCAQPLCH